MTASIGSILSVARTALSAHEAAIGVISGDLAKGTTEGHSRQRAELVHDRPMQTSGDRIGTGARVAEIGRLRDTMLDEISGASCWSRRSALPGADIHVVLASQADIRRSSVSGVSTDEEVVQLIRFQNAYCAAARVVCAADEMLQTILDMKR